jgi:hypothetical protein
MPIHDWTKVQAGIFHDFHHTWITEIKRALNAGLLPPGYYALAEQIAGGRNPDVLALEAPTQPKTSNGSPNSTDGGGNLIALATAPPQVQFRARTEIDLYAEKSKAVVIRHSSDHRVIAVVEIVSPGNKSCRHELRMFVEKAVEMLFAGIHLLIIDLFPPSRRDPEGIHRVIWDELRESDFTLPAGKPLTLVAYAADERPEAFIEPTAVHRPLVDMPLFLEPGEYIRVPLETTYGAAWEAVPSFWRGVLEPSEAS